MEIRIIFILIFIIMCIRILFTNNKSIKLYENFFKESYNTLILTDESVFTEQEIINLFKNNDIIQIKIPDNYIARIVYKENKIINLPAGKHDVHKYLDDKIIYHIDIIPEYLINNIANPGHSVQDWEFNYFKKNKPI